MNYYYQFLALLKLIHEYDNNLKNKHASAIELRRKLLRSRDLFETQMNEINAKTEKQNAVAIQFLEKQSVAAKKVNVLKHKQHKNQKPTKESVVLPEEIKFENIIKLHNDVLSQISELKTIGGPNGNKLIGDTPVSTVTQMELHLESLKSTVATLEDKLDQLSIDTDGIY